MGEGLIYFSTLQLKDNIFIITTVITYIPTIIKVVHVYLYYYKNNSYVSFSSKEGEIIYLFLISKKFI